jgi:hypothetical protein
MNYQFFTCRIPSGDIYDLQSNTNIVQGWYSSTAGNPNVGMYIPDDLITWEYPDYDEVRNYYGIDFDEGYHDAPEAIVDKESLLQVTNWVLIEQNEKKSIWVHPELNWEDFVDNDVRPEFCYCDEDRFLIQQEWGKEVQMRGRQVKGWSEAVLSHLLVVYQDYGTKLPSEEVAKHFRKILIRERASYKLYQECYEYRAAWNWVRSLGLDNNVEWK